MTEAEHLIRQAARELQITVTIVTKAAEPDLKTMEVINTYKVTFFRNNGDAAEIEITDGMDYIAIHDALKAGNKGKPQSGNQT